MIINLENNIISITDHEFIITPNVEGGDNIKCHSFADYSLDLLRVGNMNNNHKMAILFERVFINEIEYENTFAVITHGYLDDKLKIAIDFMGRIDAYPATYVDIYNMEDRFISLTNE